MTKRPNDLLHRHARHQKQMIGEQPGSVEFVIGLGVYLVCVIAIALCLWLLRDQTALRGVFGSAANGGAGILSVLIAAQYRNLELNAFGFRVVAWYWIIIGILLGFLAVPVSMGIEHLYFSFVQEADTQADFRASATAGATSLLMLCVTGAMLTPFGEEVLFRGVIANALNRYGAWAGIGGSALIFAAVHGPSVIFFDALMAGIVTAWLFRKTASVWPGFAVHGVYNLCWLLLYSLT